MNLRKTYEEEFQDYVEAFSYKELVDYIVCPLDLTEFMSEDIAGLGKAIEPLSTVGAELLKKLLGPAFDEAGQFLGNELEFYKLRRRHRLNGLLAEAKKKLDEQGITPQPVEPKILVPILEKGSLETEKSELNEKWVSLLAAAAAGNQMHPRYTELLSQIGSTEVRILDRICHLYIKNDQTNDPEQKQEILGNLKGEPLKISIKASEREFSSAISNLMGLGLCDISLFAPGGITPQGLSGATVSLTLFGRDFMEAILF